MTTKHPPVSLENVVVQRSGSPFQLRLNLSVEPGQWISIMGPSGSGKSTVLETLAGFVTPQSGRILMGHNDITQTPSHMRPFGYVFQTNALFPFLNIEKNLRLAFSKSEKQESQQSTQIKECLERLRLPITYLSKFPSELSGGELARANIARALLQDKAFLLLDEPFASLDEPLRAELNNLLFTLLREKNLGIITVTHHQLDAWCCADRVLLLNAGQVVSQGSPREMLGVSDPFSAEFLGLTRELRDQHGKEWRVSVANLRCQQTNSDDLVFSFANSEVLATPQGAFLKTKDTSMIVPLPIDGTFKGKLFLSQL